MKVAVVGSRSLGGECYALLRSHIPAGCSEIISGGAKGVDELAQRYAEEAGLRLTVLRPDYDVYNKSAPLVRNADIIRQADYVLVFWDGASKGSLSVIMTCLKLHKPIRLLLPKTGK